MSARVRDTAGRKDLSWPAVPDPLPLAVYDNHTHLDFEDGTAQLTVADGLRLAEQAGVAGVIQVGTSVDTSAWGAALAAADPRVLAAVAVHPNDAPARSRAGLLDADLTALGELAAQPRVRAIGETGLDFCKTGEDGRAAQFAAFEGHIALAKQHGIAMQIHDRDAHAEVVETLTRLGAPEHTVFHCFSGGPELARVCNDNGWMMSFSGTVTFKNAPELREALRIADPRLLLVETDAPFLTPHPLRGRPNAPYLLPHTVRRIASELDCDLPELCATLNANTERVYGSWSAGE